MTTIKIQVTHRDAEFDIREEYEVSIEMFDAMLKKENQKEMLYEKVWSLRNNVTNELVRMQMQKKVNS